MSLLAANLTKISVGPVRHLLRCGAANCKHLLDRMLFSFLKTKSVEKKSLSFSSLFILSLTPQDLFSTQVRD